ncbi:hypothetical protein CGLO_12309 [Colletotrichum gloeosporioides Cg-14]|uniref:Uncharacterized protein n=1 Tax=Colletotrichum gloeosporioides (strain Cg-14) TaxID=1237896 RepID=T0JZ78_COLGC|nr:hypothetical protein CGLO_12309 [Colletotrichum gloeosporioides Cg-14]
MPLSVEAVLAIVFGICGVIIAVLGVIFAYITMNRSHQRQARASFELRGSLIPYSLYHHPPGSCIPWATPPSFQRSETYWPRTASQHSASEIMITSYESLIDNGHFYGRGPPSFGFRPRYPHV